MASIYKAERDYKTETIGCPPRVLPEDGKAALSLVHPDIIAQNYCCGLRFPHLLCGLRVLSLGCGSVRDCFVLSKLIGQTGEVVGVDPNEHVVSFGQRFLDYHLNAVGYSENNVRFLQGEHHDLLDAGLKKDYFDLICFNTVIGLTPKTNAILGQLKELLKTGGEIFFTEMIASSRVREEVKKDQSLWAEGLAGAFYWEDLAGSARKFGFSNPRLVHATAMRIKEAELEKFIGGVKYSMATYRMFKLPTTTSQEQDEVMIYINPAESDVSMNVIKFDASNKFKTGEPVRIDKEMAAILTSSRYSSVFTKTTDSTEETLMQCPMNPFEFC